MATEHTFDGEALLAGARPSLYGYLLAMTSNTHDAEDLTQETLVRAWRALPQLRDQAAAKAWLFRIATNVAIERGRAGQRRPPTTTEPADLDAASPGTGPALRLEQTEMAQCVTTLTDRLPEAQRLALLLHDAHGLSNPEIAEILGCSVPAVKIRLHRARARLGQLLEAACHLGPDHRGVLVCDRPGPSEP